MYTVILWANVVLICVALFLGAAFQWLKLFSKKDLTDEKDCETVSKNTTRGAGG